MKHWLYLFSLACLSYNCSSQEFKIVKLEPLADSSLRDRPDSKFQYYIIYGFKDDKETTNKLDSFVRLNKAPDYCGYSTYVIIFLKSSSRTNPDHLGKRPVDFHRYSMPRDMVLKYTWSRCRFINKYKYRNGEQIEPEDQVDIEVLQ
jgi:hypothetical protein